MIDRLLELREIQEDSLFLWGARQTGKSTFLKAKYPDARLFVVSLDARPRLFHGVEVYPVMDFLKKMWKGELV